MMEFMLLHINVLDYVEIVEGSFHRKFVMALPINNAQK